MANVNELYVFSQEKLEGLYVKRLTLLPIQIYRVNFVEEYLCPTMTLDLIYATWLPLNKKKIYICTWLRTTRI